MNKSAFSRNSPKNLQRKIPLMIAPKIICFHFLGNDKEIDSQPKQEQACK